jgi:hypothetical protein
MESAATMEATAAAMSECHCVGRHRQTKRDSRRDRNHFATHRSLSFHAPGPPSDAPSLTPVRKKSLWPCRRPNELQIANETNARSWGATIAAALLATVNQIAQWFGSLKGKMCKPTVVHRRRLCGKIAHAVRLIPVMGFVAWNFGSWTFRESGWRLSNLNFEFNSRRVNGGCAMIWQEDRSNQ